MPRARINFMVAPFLHVPLVFSPPILRQNHQHRKNTTTELMNRGPFLARRFAFTSRDLIEKSGGWSAIQSLEARGATVTSSIPARFQRIRPWKEMIA